jgi:hypothetical protein
MTTELRKEMKGVQDTGHETAFVPLSQLILPVATSTVLLFLPLQNEGARAMYTSPDVLLLGFDLLLLTYFSDILVLWGRAITMSGSC